MRGTVSSGHPLTAGAAAEMLSRGGNAFDAAIAAGFASVVSEPSLTSFGGGGFFLAHIEKEEKDILFDFFVNTPGLDHTGNLKPVMTPIDIQFPECTQVFHTGMGSAAVPGMLKGLLHVHDRLCTLPLKTIIAPAVRYLEEGIEVSRLQAYFLSLLEPIFTSTEYGKDMYMFNGKYVKEHDQLQNPQLKSFFGGIADGRTDIYSGAVARELIEAMKAQNGLITGEDLASYKVIEREPLFIHYRDRVIVTNPPPSSGGIMIALGLHMLEKLELSALPHDSDEFLISLIEMIKKLHDFKPMKNGSRLKYPFADATTESLVRSFQDSISGKTFLATRGTTHISVVDQEGNAASMTTSNGSGSGCFIPGTGIMLNNMMGEDDLHPDGFFASAPGQRVSSMMIPTIVLKDGKVEAVMGSGGSKRIKTAVLQVLINLIDYNYSLEEAVEKSRIHFEDGVVQIEPEITPEIAEKLNSHYNIKLWNSKNMYFGGVHCVNGSMEGWGDSRRGGSFISVK